MGLYVFQGIDQASLEAKLKNANGASSSDSNTNNVVAVADPTQIIAYSDESDQTINLYFNHIADQNKWQVSFVNDQGNMQWDAIEEDAVLKILAGLKAFDLNSLNADQKTEVVNILGNMLPQVDKTDPSFIASAAAQPNYKPLPKKAPQPHKNDKLQPAAQTTNDFLNDLPNKTKDTWTTHVANYLAGITDNKLTVISQIIVSMLSSSTDATSYEAKIVDQLISGLPDAASIGKLLSIIPADKWLSLLSPAMVSKFMPNAAELAKVLNGLDPALWNNLLGNKAIVGLTGSIPALAGLLNDLDAGKWAALLGLPSIAQLIPDAVAVGKLLSALDPKNWAQVLQIPAIATLVHDARAAGQVIKQLPAGQWQNLIAIPSVAGLINTPSDIGLVANDIPQKDQAAFLAHPSLAKTMGALNFAGVATILTEVTGPERSAFLNLAPMKTAVDNLSKDVNNLSQVSDVLHVLAPSDWAGFLSSSNFKTSLNNGEHLGTVLSTLPDEHISHPYYKDFLDAFVTPALLPSSAGLKLLLKKLNPQQGTAFIASSTVAENLYTRTLAANPKDSMLTGMDLSKSTDEQKKSLLTATLKGYKEHNNQAHKYRFSLFNRLGNKKTANVNAAITEAAKPATTFDSLLDKVEKDHKPAADKANKFWLFSNRWKSHIGGYGDTKKEAYDENKHSNLGNIITRFKKR